jgi:hypothetical protein
MFEARRAEGARRVAIRSLEVGMSDPNLGFDGRNLLAATRDSCHLPFAGDLLEGAAVTVEPGLFPLKVCQRCTITSTYLGSSSRPLQTRSVSSAGRESVPDPRSGSYTASPRFR